MALTSGPDCANTRAQVATVVPTAEHSWPRLCTTARHMDQVASGSTTLAATGREFQTHRPLRTLRLLLMTAVVVYTAATAVRFYVRNYYVFFPDYVRWTFTPSPSADTTHLFVLLVDHFEPNFRADLTEEWLAKYTTLAARH